MRINLVGMDKIGPEVMSKAQRFVPAIDESLTAGVKAGAFLTKTSIQAISPKKLRGVSWRKGGAKIGVRYQIRRGTYGPYAVIGAYGPFHLLERDTRQHPAPSVAGRARKTGGLDVFGPAFNKRAGKAKVMKIGNDFAVGPFLVGGSKGKHTFAKGTEIAKPKLSSVMKQAQRQALVRTML